MDCKEKDKLNEEDWKKMHEASIFMNLQVLRNQGLAQESKDGLLGIERIGKTGFVENTNGFIEVGNSKDELLGILYKFKKWDKWVWEQDIGVIMSKSCLKEVTQYMEKLC